MVFQPVQGQPEPVGTDTSQSQGSPSEVDMGGYSEFAQGLLKDVPKEHLQLLQPYVQKWDAGVSRRFQDLHNQYAPYKGLNWDANTVQEVQEVYRVLNEEPERLYAALKEQFDTGEAQTSETSQESPQTFQVPPELQTQMQQQRELLEALAQFTLQQQQKEQQSIEDQELNDYLTLLEKEFGKFDRDYVLTMIANEVDGETAVKAWNSKIQEALNAAGQTTANLPPAVLSSAGGSAVAAPEQQKLGDIPGKDVRQLIANVVSQANQAAQ